MDFQRRVLRYAVPIDGDAHQIGRGRILHVAPARHLVVRDADRALEVWVDVQLPPTWPAVPEPTQDVVVFGTGRVLPERSIHLGSCLMGDRLVWHLYGVTTSRQPQDPEENPVT